MNIKNRFNLVDEPWIPIVQVGKVSLKQIFTNTSYGCLGGNPIQKIALMKLLLAISQAAYTPDNYYYWFALKPSDLGKKCINYLEKWHDRFFLYGNKPFLQMPDISTAKIRNISEVLPEISTGNTTVLSQIQVERVLTDDEKALLITTLMGFGFGGKKTDNSVVLSQGYQGKSNDKGKPSTGKPGTFMGHFGFLHSFILGESILKTIWLNLLSHETIKDKLKCPNGLGFPPWEDMPTGEDDETAQVLKNSFMGRLIPMNRFCLLLDGKEGLHYSEGISYPPLKDENIDPTLAIDFSHEKPKVIWADPEKRPCRYLTGLLSFINSQDNQGFNCIQLQEGLKKIHNHLPKVKIWSGGIRASGSTAGEQYVSGLDDFVESTFTFENEFFDVGWYERFHQEVKELDKLEKIIYGCTFKFFKSQNGDAEKKTSLVKGLFWQLCERQFPELLLACNDMEKLKNMRLVFFKIVHQIYDNFCPKETGRQIAMWAKCRPSLGKYLSLREE